MIAKTFLVVCFPDSLACRASCYRALAALIVGVSFSVPAARAQFEFTNIWSLAPGDRTYVTSAAGNERGITVNPVTTNVLLVSRATTPPTVAVLNGNDGSEIRLLDTTGVTGGFFALNKIQVDEDGVVWAANMTLNGTTANYRIYRWNSEEDTAPPAVAWEGDPGAGTAFRWGDSFALRGKGADLQILASGSANNNRIAFFTTADGTSFTLTTLVPSIASGVYGKGLAFYTNETFLTKHSPETILRTFGFDLGAATATQLTTATIDNTMVGIQADLAKNLLVGTLSDNAATAAGHQVRIYDFANPGTPVLLGTFSMPGPYTADANRAGEADIANDLIVGVSSQNGVVAIRALPLTNAVPPSIVTQPERRTVLQGGYVTFSVAATGTQPLTYQWFFNDTNTLTGQTNTTLTLTNLAFSDAGAYSVAISNVAGSTNSASATLDVQPAVLSSAMRPIWSLRPGSRPYLASDNNQRGMAFNRVNNHLLIVSRTPSPAIRVLNADDGSDVGSLDMTGVGGQTGETFPINLVGVTDDGVVYACNLGNTTSGAGFTIYRWSNDDPNTVPTVAYGPAVPTANRIGDVMDVRGSDLNLTTQIICPSRENSMVLILGINIDGGFNQHVIDVPGTPTGTRGFAGLGVAFGTSNTFWGKSASFPATHVSFDLDLNTATVLGTYFPSSTSTFSNTTVLGIDAQNDLLATIAYNETPDNLQLFDIVDLAKEPTLLDQEFFPADNENGNGTGAIDFDVNGGRVFALESNNGIIALRVGARLKQVRLENDLILSWTGPSVLESAIDVTGPYTEVSGAASPHTHTISGTTRFFRLRR